ncbi:hypothetical protein ESCO_001431 [Escovopsis weberi]|uniref:Zn(2)-C6 fungal-type domain-containing protein n=1 Tax=Escovopsis weberi TaxID=150374 RepID=A0A0M9VWN7_ESCWE|nr:hypothetical protein ESCO_001431 [Escovopsis weberi]
MADNADPIDAPVSLHDLTPDEASRIIHSHRKVRYVKCDNQQPCVNCVKREHAQLCQYKPNRSSAAKNHAAASNASHGRKRARSQSEARDEDDKALQGQDSSRDFDC